MTIANHHKTGNISKSNVLGFKQPVKLKVTVTSHAFGLIFRDFTRQIVASRISLLPPELTGKREQAAIFALATAKRMSETEALQGYRVALVHCPALPPSGPGERRRAA